MCLISSWVWSADPASHALQESFLDEGFILDKRIGVGQPKRLENARILVANTAMDTDKVKIYGARVRVDSMQKARVVAGPAGVPSLACLNVPQDLHAASRCACAQ